MQVHISYNVYNIYAFLYHSKVWCKELLVSDKNFCLSVLGDFWDNFRSEFWVGFFFGVGFF